jgi:RTX calcium-binding nonapeptide repeat (4 copies)
VLYGHRSGALNDYIEGDEGSDIIFGDFGVYDSLEDYPQYKSFIAYATYAGNDTIRGGEVSVCRWCLIATWVIALNCYPDVAMK